MTDSDKAAAYDRFISMLSDTVALEEHRCSQYGTGPDERFRLSLEVDQLRSFAFQKLVNTFLLKKTGAAGA